jgi:23S rRNA A2030 N6-methylase RlmJ
MALQTISVGRLTPVIGGELHGVDLRGPITDEVYQTVHDALLDSLQRFPTGVFVAWLPVKLRGDFDHWFAALGRAVTRPMLASLLWVHPPDSRAALNGSALVLVNPPYLLEQRLREWLPELAALLGAARKPDQGGCEVLATSERG